MVNLTVVFQVHTENEAGETQTRRFRRRYVLLREDLAQTVIDLLSLDGKTRAGVTWEVLRISITKPAATRGVVDRMFETALRAF